MKFLISFLILTLAFGVVHAKKTDADAALSSYFEDATKKTEARTTLRDMDRVDVASAIYDYIKDEDTREEAIDLAIDLNVPHLYPVLKDVLETDLMEKAVTLLMVTKDEDAIEDLYKVYKKTDDKVERLIIYEAFTKYGIDAKLLRKIKSDAFKEKKDLQLKAEMVEVIRFQMGLEQDYTFDKIKDEWKDLLKNYELVSKQIDADGWDILSYDDVTTTKTYPAGFNTRIADKGEIKLNMRADKYQRKSLVIRAMVYFPEGSDGYVSVRSGSGVWTISSNAKEWSIQSRQANKIKRYNEWQEIVVTISDESAEGQTPKQMISLTIGGNELFPSKGYINGGLQDLAIGSTSGDAYIAYARLIS